MKCHNNLTAILTLNQIKYIKKQLKAKIRILSPELIIHKKKIKKEENNVTFGNEKNSFIIENNKN